MIQLSALSLVQYIINGFFTGFYSGFISNYEIFSYFFRPVYIQNASHYDLKDGYVQGYFMTYYVLVDLY